MKDFDLLTCSLTSQFVTGSVNLRVTTCQLHVLRTLVLTYQDLPKTLYEEFVPAALRKLNSILTLVRAFNTIFY